MNEKEISELRRRFKSDKTGISRIRGAYVNEKREIISEMDQSLATLSETECDQILSVFKKTLSGKPDTNLLPIAFSTTDVMESEQHKLLSTLRETALTDNESVHAFYRKVMDNLELKGNYMILLAADSYDVFTYRKDGAKDDESTEVFRYIICAICPIQMAKPALSYYVRENCFRNIVADSMLSPPALGFIFPAFDDRTTNIYGALYYTRATDESHTELTDAIFRAGDLPMPAAEQKSTFRAVLSDAVGEDCSLSVVRAVHASLNQAMIAHKESKEPEPLYVDKYAIREILDYTGVSDERIERFEERFDEEFGQGAALAPRNLVETRRFELKTPDVVIKVNPERTDLVETRIIDGVRYVLIRADNGVEVNGVDVRIHADGAVPVSPAAQSPATEPSAGEADSDDTAPPFDI